MPGGTTIFEVIALFASGLLVCILALCKKPPSFLISRVDGAFTRNDNAATSGVIRSA